MNIQLQLNLLHVLQITLADIRPDMSIKKEKGEKKKCDHLIR